MLPEGVSCPSLGIFSEVVRCELLALSEELAVLSQKAVNIKTPDTHRGAAWVLRPRLNRELTSDRTCWGESPLSADDNDMAKVV